MAADVTEVDLGDWILRLDGRVVEGMHRAGVSHRYHVQHVAVEGKPRGDDLRVRLGVETAGVIVEGAAFTVPAARKEEVMALFAEARALRDGPA